MKQYIFRSGRATVIVTEGRSQTEKWGPFTWCTVRAKGLATMRREQLRERLRYVHPDQVCHVLKDAFTFEGYREVEPPIEELDWPLVAIIQYP